MESYVKNSCIINRNPPVDGGMFVQTSNGDILARLDGFIVIPIERVPDIDAFWNLIGVDTDPAPVAV